MFCRNCDTELATGAIACTSCGLPPLAGKKFCNNCGKDTNPDAIMCISCGTALGKGGAAVAGQGANRMTVGICAILLGSLGVHKFILGYTQEAIIMLLVTLVGSWLTFGIGGGVMAIIGIIEGVIYLTKSDAEFADTYIAHKKAWF